MFQQEFYKKIAENIANCEISTRPPKYKDSIVRGLFRIKMITFIPKSNYNLCTITFFEVKQFQNIHILKFFNIKRTAYKKIWSH